MRQLWGYTDGVEFHRKQDARARLKILGLSPENSADVGLSPVWVEDPPAVERFERVVERAPALVQGEWIVSHDVIRSPSSQIKVGRPGFAAAAMEAGLLSEQEAKDWAGGQSIPAQVLSIFATLEEMGRRRAEIMALGISTVGRDAALIEALRVSYGLTHENMDALFDAAAQIEVGS